MLLARKIVNASELLWDSLDQGERMIVVYAGLWAALVAYMALRRSQRERLRREIVEEIASGAHA